MTQERISSIERLLLFEELLDSAIRHSSHPANLHEMERRLESAELEAMNNISYHCWQASLYFGIQQIREEDLYPQSGSMQYVPADERFLD